ncbi:thioredoxin family protein [Actinomadura hibisca]|uniref:thioredoxin family protein n=1 Tax=Actinomadura hibisca TaxID=68565 RepID=UPI000A026690|nr:thioredoxin [Actinomadura hibisca]
MSDDQGHAPEPSDYEMRLWSREERVLRFPADRSVGELQIHAVGDDEPVSVTEAQGEVTVPAGHMVSLECADEEAAGDLAFLDDLPDDAFAGFAAMGVNGAGLRRLGRQKDLFQVILEEPQAGDEDLAVLGQLPDLEILALDDEGSTGAWLAELAATSLMLLELHRTETGAAALHGIGKIGTLYNLKIVTGLLETGRLHELGSLPDLEAMTLWADTPIAAEQLSFAATMPELKVLDLKRQDGADALSGADRLALLKTLPDVDVNGLWYPAEKLNGMTAADLEDREASGVRVIDDEGAFNRVLVESRFVLAYFTAAWCGPCKQFGPLIDRFADDYADRLSVAKIDIDVAPELADRFQIQGVPTVFLLEQGEIVGSQTGAMPRRDLVEFVEPLLGTGHAGE